MRNMLYSFIMAAALLSANWTFADSKVALDPTIPQSLGVNTHFLHPPAGEMDMLAASGFKWVRTDFNWQTTEKSAGVYNFDVFDQLLAGYEAHGIHVIFCLSYGNPLYEGFMAPRTDAGRLAFCEWAVAAVKHFKGHGIMWEIWNEPNSLHGWLPARNVDQYVHLALDVSKAIKQAAPDEWIVGPALSKIDDPFLESCLKSGLLQYWNAVTVHPYRDGDPETVGADYERLRVLIQRYAPPGKQIPLISGEWGYPSIDNIDENQQASLMTRMSLINLANAIPLSIWYDWHDDGPDPKNPQHHYGMVAYKYYKGRATPYDPKPAYLAAKTLSSVLDGYRFNKRLDSASPADYILLFSKADSQALAVWTTGPAHELSVPASAGEFNVVSLTGQALPTLTADGHGLRVQVTDAPQYLVPRAPNDLLHIAAAWQPLPVQVMAAAPTRVVVQNQISNPTGRAIHVQAAPGGTLEIAPGKSATVSLPVDVLRSQTQPSLKMTVTVDGAAPLTQQAPVTALDPFRVVVTPGASHVFWASVRNPSGEAFRGTIGIVCADAKASAPLDLKTGETEATAQLDTNAAAPAQGSIKVDISTTDGQCAAQSTQQYNGDVLGDLKAWQLRTLGDPKAPSVQSISMAPPPAPSPCGDRPVFKIDYNFPAAPKYLYLTSTNPADRAIAGKPDSLGMWLYGDGSGNVPIIRFRDSTGQIFQPGLARITWTGWKYISFPMNDPDVWHYGGAADGTIHYPIQWEALFMLDKGNQKEPTKGEIFFSQPTLIWNSTAAVQ